MNLSELEKKGEIQKIDKDQKTAEELIKSAEKDITAAIDILKSKHYDWALAIAYTGMLNAGRALMFAKGYRTRSDSHHLTVVRFCAAILPSESSSLISLFNRYRIRRNDIIYGEAEDSVSESESKRVINNAKKFIKEIKERINKN